MADKIQISTSAGVLVKQWDDGTSTYTEYDSTTGAQTLSRAYTAAETTAAQTRAQLTTATANLATLQSKIQTALTNNTNYLAIASPTNAQILAQVTPLMRQMNAVLRILSQSLSDISNT